MESLGEVLKYLYSQFILRDCFGKMVPGAVLMVSLAFVALGAAKAKRLVRATGHWKMRHIIVVVALCWPMGFVIQRIGNAAALSRIDFSPQDLRAANKTVQDSVTRDVPPHVLAKAGSYKRYVSFFKVADEHQRLRQERFVIIKETTGNLALALGFAICGIGFGLVVDWLRAGRMWSSAPWTQYQFWASGVVLLGVAVTLHLSHREHSSKQNDYEDLVIQAAQVQGHADTPHQLQLRQTSPAPTTIAR